MFREEEERKEKSLLNSFPFNQAKGHGDHASHGTHGEYHGHEEHGGHHGEHGEHHGHGEHGEHHGHGDHEGHEEHIDHERHHHADVGVATSPLRQDLSNRNSGLGQSQLVAFADRNSQFRQEEGGKGDDTEVSINTVVTKGLGEGEREMY